MKNITTIIVVIFCVLGLAIVGFADTAKKIQGNAQTEKQIIGPQRLTSSEQRSKMKIIKEELSDEKINNIKNVGDIVPIIKALRDAFYVY